MHLIMVALFQGLHETAYGGASDVEWELSEGDGLEVEVTPRS